MKERRVEEHAERAERLAAPLRPEADEDDVAVAVANVERGCMALENLLAEQVAGQER